MSGTESILIPIIGSILGGMMDGGQDSSPTMDYSQPPPGQIDPMFEPGMQDLVNIWRNMLFTNPALNSIMTGGGYLGSLFDPGTNLSLFGKPVDYSGGTSGNFGGGSPTMIPTNPAEDVYNFPTGGNPPYITPTNTAGSNPMSAATAARYMTGLGPSVASGGRPALPGQMLGQQQRRW